ncbi:MAG TPA: hypothetical protein VLJ79_31575 [Candidatus Binatia bacterium]|nr:hypothetical protein [Candidatus Binatia bacterium]
MTLVKEEFFAALTASGMPEIPQDFSVVPLAQLIPLTTLVEIDNFIRLFDRITTRTTWQQVVTTSAPEIAQFARSEACFFTAWDFHLSPEQGWQLIECNDNGSGFLFAALINRLFYELSDLRQDRSIEEPASLGAFTEQLASFIEREAKEFFGALPDGLFFVLETSDALRSSKFYRELILLRDLLRHRGWHSEIGTPDDLQWDGNYLLVDRQPVVFVINRSTDFFWEAEAFSPLRAAYLEGKVYVAPNPFTYATRSDKHLLEFLSVPDWDQKLGILPDERAVLSAHVPATYLLREENLGEIAAKKAAFFFKPVHGFASHGVLTSSQVGKGRLRQLLKKEIAYVAQKTVPKPTLVSEVKNGKVTLWTDLRVWAYRGERYLISGRASKQRDLLVLAPPGGWLATFAAKQAG